MKILLIEDDSKMARHIVQALGEQGYIIDECASGVEGLARARVGSHTALIVDRMLPDLDGLSLVKQLRNDGIKTPVLFLTTMSGINDRVEGLEGGGDDYLVKPFAFEEFIARVRALARRGEIASASSEPICLRVRDLEMDLIRRTVTRGGKPVELQVQEFKLLEYLMRNAGQVVTRTMLLEKVWNIHFDPRTNVVETHVSRLRTKLAASRGRRLIRNVRGVGYILRAD